MQDETNNEICCEIYLNLMERLNKMLATNLKKREKITKQIAYNNGLIPHLFVIANKYALMPDVKSQNTFLIAVRLFNRLAFQSCEQSLEILNNRVDKQLISYIENNELNLNSGKENSSQSQVINEIISLVNTFQSIRAMPSPIFVKIADLAGIKILEHVNYKEKLEMLNKNKSLIIDIQKLIQQKSSEIYEVNEDLFFKYVQLTCLEKIFIFLSKEEITEFVNFNTLAVFLTMILDTKDMLLITIATQITQVLVPKIGQISNFLLREGFIQTLNGISRNNKNLGIYSIKTKIPTLLDKTRLGTIIMNFFGNYYVLK